MSPHKKLIIAAQGTMVLQLTSASNTVWVAVTTLVVFYLEVSATLTVVVRASAFNERVALLSITS